MSGKPIPGQPGEALPLPWWRDRLLLLAAVVFVGWSCLALTWPLSGDAGVFAWMADALFRGGRPYVDTWDTKGVAAWLPSLIVEGVFGRTSWGIRLFDIAMVLSTVVAMRAVARRLGQPGAGRVGVALYLLWYASLDYWQSAQPDGWVAAWLIIACALALRGTATGVVSAGALVGACTLVKPFYIGYAVVLLMIVAFARDRTTAHRVGHSLLVLTGVAMGVGVLLLFTRWWGGLDGFLDVQRWNRDVYSGLSDPWLTRIPAIFKGALVMPWGIVGPIALFGAIRPTRAHRRTIAALSVGFLGAVAGVMLQGKGWMYHWLPMLPFLALLADIGFAALRTETAGEIAGRFRWLALVLALAVAGITPVQQLFRWARSRVSADTIAEYERREFRYYGRHPGSAYAIVDSLARLQPDTARVLVWAMHPAPAFLAGLPSVTPYAVIRPLFDGPGSAFRERYRNEFEQSLRRNPPRWWIVPSAALVAREEELQIHNLANYPVAESILRAAYAAAAETPDWVVYELKPPGQPRITTEPPPP